MSEAADSFLNEIEEVLAMVVVKENAGVAIAAQHRVVYGAGVMDSGLAGHCPEDIPRSGKNQNITRPPALMVFVQQWLRFVALSMVLSLGWPDLPANVRQALRETPDFSPGKKTGERGRTVSLWLPL